VTSAWLVQRGVSYELAAKYAKSGWLDRLSQGVYARPGQPLLLQPSLQLLAGLKWPYHVGGKTALAWHGFLHNVSPNDEAVTLFIHAKTTNKVPQWFGQQFKSQVSSRLLFNESDAAKPLLVTNDNNRHPGIGVSEPERAVLEMLSEVPKAQDLEEAEHLMEGMVSLRAEAQRTALKACVNVKTVRLFLYFAKRLDLPVLNSLVAEEFPTGSKSRYVLPLASGTLVLKP
jgi:hypothetical protein